MIPLLIIFICLGAVKSKNFLDETYKSSKNELRNLWEEDMIYNTSGRNSDDKISIQHCADSNYKYFNFLLSGAEVTFDNNVNNENAVRNDF